MKIYAVKPSQQKWLEDPLNFVEIKNPFGSFQTSLKTDAWWVTPKLFVKKLDFLDTQKILFQDKTNMMKLCHLYVACLVQLLLKESVLTNCLIAANVIKGNPCRFKRILSELNPKIAQHSFFFTSNRGGSREI